MNTSYTKPDKKNIAKSRLVMYSLSIGHDEEYIKTNFRNAMMYIAFIYRRIIKFYFKQGIHVHVISHENNVIILYIIISVFIGEKWCVHTCIYHRFV